MGLGHIRILLCLFLFWLASACGISRENQTPNHSDSNVANAQMESQDLKLGLRLYEQTFSQSSSNQTPIQLILRGHPHTSNQAIYGSKYHFEVSYCIKNIATPTANCAFEAVDPNALIILEESNQEEIKAEVALPFSPDELSESSEVLVHASYCIQTCTSAELRLSASDIWTASESSLILQAPSQGTSP